MTEIQKDFEQWQVETGKTDPQWLALKENDQYRLNDVQGEWEIWQAAATFYAEKADLITDEEILQEVIGTDLYLDARDDELIAFARIIEQRTMQARLYRTDLTDERIVKLANYHNIPVREDWESEPAGRVDKEDVLEFVCAILKEAKKTK